ncbi:tRNA (adenosine(37)-N6)-threonylcarbamoyltransferase complex dimerization subunit type 1 TsaB [Paenibacillus sp. NEAU-GSW1]|uniref:tRNA (adenosine(37)-N6)-threonylcarbamoyltransferase complex dimerization subunit type 1 TsaB n=1 Tax=Paenibacillus sp. NEAU-GSW1 TaxID=2682486 RepID=UPI0012E1F0BA|nr:tRNA (adenosine(37)-N6)-threonylcarbamoyltransferase complex dimerization subunit type 1 TsaB [Paenibacillus sp. NEAU-GSW1]MUT68465.1 tRNA (adenosine(37)-N6)-threonylcarbamoyltransferase complex dimerization subunit type 1 TsaB [Paenibacillus sp. NEAU-GSW1]
MIAEKNDRPVLAFDTSTAAMAAAIRKGSVTLGEIQSLAERNHSVHIIVHLKQLMEQCGVSSEALGAIAVGSGPGSYTGMRIAVAAAKTLAWAWKKPLVGVSSLEAIAYGALKSSVENNFVTSSSQSLITEWVLPIMDARRGQVYTAGFAMSPKGEWSRFADDGVRLMHEWVDRIAERIAGEASQRAIRIWLAGDLSLHEAEALRLQKLCGEAGVEVRLQPYELEGRYVAELGQLRLDAGEIDNAHTFTPNYTQLTEAEVKLKAKQAEQAQAEETKR